MGETLNLSHEKRELFVEMIHHMARFEWQALGGSDPTFQAAMWDRAESVHEHTCEILRQLGVFEHLANSSNYRFLMPLDKVREHAANLQARTTYSFERIIGCFLWCTAGYEDSLSDEHEPFAPRSGLEGAMWAFVKSGYADRVGDKFQWSAKIAPIMIAECLWSLDGESHTTLHKQVSQELTETIWASIPVWRRHLLARWVVGKSGQDLFVHLFQRWDGRRVRLMKRRKSSGWFNLPEGYEEATREIGQRLAAIRRKHPI